MNSSKFIVIYDTYCGWCYGAAPVFDALVDAGAEVEPLHRQLFHGAGTYVMAEGKGDLVMKADARIAALSGQIFTRKYVDNIVKSPTEVLDSKYTAQAAALVHDRGVEFEFALREKLETARFVGGTSAADRDAVVAALIDLGVPPQEAEKIGSPELEAAAEETARRAKALMDRVGSRGVPTILKVSRDKVEVVDHAAYVGRASNIAELVDTPRRRSA